MRVVLVQVDCLLHEQWILAHRRLIFVSLRRWHAMACFFASKGTKTVVFGMAKHSQDGTGTDRSVVCRIHERPTTSARSIRLPDRIVMLTRCLGPVVRGIDELVVRAAVEHVELNILDFQLVGVAALLQSQILTTIFADQPIQ